MPTAPRSADDPRRIALISATILILELAFIRQVPAEVQAISYFTNLILVASFFGLGLGCILQQRRSLAALIPLGLVLQFLFVFAARGIVIYPETRDVHYWLRSEEIAGQAWRLPLVLAAIAAFVTTAIAFIGLGQALARAMDRHPRLIAYGWDIAGSLIGVVLFALSSYLRMPPWVWPPVTMGIWALVFLRLPAARLGYFAAGLTFLAFAISPHAFRWSPYYYVQYAVEPEGIRVWVNSSFHQLGIDFTSQDPHHQRANRTVFERWSRPYRLYQELNGKAPERVLILGAGTGNDVNVALANGAKEIVAVEIDPVILELGERHNATEPYRAAEVTSRVDDARSVLREEAPESFDLLVFGTLDSQALLSSHANLRLENYVYTTEAFADARALLRERGMVAVYYSVYQPWLYSRIYATVRAVFGDAVRIHLEDSHLLFNTTIVAAKGIEGFADRPENVERFGGGLPSTDDWPFIYLERPTISALYWQLFALVGTLIVGAFALLRKLHPVRGLHADFLLLGLGFTLVESSAIVRLTLVFGSTWVVNAVVFAALLLMIFIANWSVLAGRAPRLTVAWPALLAGIALNAAFPVQTLLALPAPVRALAAGALIGVPVYFAAVCFSRLFSRQAVTGYALGINLIGAMGGGLVEYLSMAIGMRRLWLLILAVYALAWLASRMASQPDEG